MPTTNTENEFIHFEYYFQAAMPWKEVENQSEVLEKIIGTIRPKNPKTVERVDISNIISFLKSNEQIRNGFREYLNNLFSDKKLVNILTDAAILKDIDFIYEVKRRLENQILPQQPQKENIEHVLNHVFHKNTDAIWVYKIPQEQLEELFSILVGDNFFKTYTHNKILNDIIWAMTILSQRMNGRSLEEDVIKMVPQYLSYESPFTAFEKEIYTLQDKISHTTEDIEIENKQTIKQLILLHKQCEEFVAKAFQNSSIYGISLRVNQNLLRIRQQLDRIKVLIEIIKPETDDLKKKNSIRLAKELIRYNCHKSDIRLLIKESIQLISYEITHHTAKTGEKYITSSKKEYYNMLYSALGGGFVVGILCIIKLWFSMFGVSDFGSAFLYSINYAIGFIIIYLMGYTLATKQPAMTASAVVNTLEKDFKSHKKKDELYSSFARFYAKVFRSQFIAFVGNVFMAFPVTLLGIWLLYLLTGHDMAESKWQGLAKDISPVHSKAIFHAAIAGFYLFFSGIIAGSIANRHKHNNVEYRLKEHPWLKKFLGKERAERFSKWYTEKAPGILSNFWFGVFMGSTGVLGYFLGLDIDIRHITFASGNLALAVFGSNYSIELSLLIWSIIGIGLIGLMNFLVSFSLSLMVALRSRSISLFEFRPILKSIFSLFRKNPLLFFFPVKEKEAGILP